MHFNHRYEIPRRSSHCALKKEPFKEGLEIISLLENSSKGYERQDFCLECFERELKEKCIKEKKSYWKSQITVKKEAAAVTPIDERALELLRSSLGQLSNRTAVDEELEGMVYLLTLYLERRGILVKRQEKRSKTGSTLFVEIAATQEVFAVHQPKLTALQLDALQKNIKREIERSSISLNKETTLN